MSRSTPSRPDGVPTPRAPATVSNRSSKILSLEVVRGVAAGMVLVHHIIAAEEPIYAEWTRSFVDPGRIGVVMFFIVSGYVIPLSLERQSLRVFVVRRVFRLFPLYWLALALYAAFDPPSTEQPLPVTTWLLNLVMVQGLLPVLTIVPTAWTLGIELLFYMQSVFSRYRLPTVPGWFAGYAWLTLFAVFMIVQGAVHRPLPATGPLLLLTAAIGHIMYARDHRGLNTAALRTMLIASAIVIPVATWLGGDADPEWPPIVYAASWALGVAMFAFIRRVGGLVSAPIARFLGDTSFGIYLLHPLIHHWAQELIGPSWVLVAASCGASYLAAAVIHRGVEAPLIAIGRRLSLWKIRSRPE